MPTATRPTKADVLTMLEKFVNVAKRGSRRLKSRKTSTKRMAGMLRRTGMVHRFEVMRRAPGRPCRRMTSWSNCARVEGSQDLTLTHHQDAVAHAQQLLELR